MSDDNQTPTVASPTAVVDHVVDRVGRRLVVGAPLGLGKSTRLLDALYERACQDPQIVLVVHTALGLVPPEPGSDLEARLRDPINQRLFGRVHVSRLMADLQADVLPSNVTVHSFFFEPGAAFASSHARLGRINANYSDVARRLADLDLNVFVQLVAPDEDRVSLSCNPDLTLPLMELIEAQRAAGRAVVLAAEVNRNLPWMGHDAAVDTARFDIVLETAGPDDELFSVPSMPVTAVDHAIGAHTAALVADGGTLQLGIGALSDAVVWMLIVRHRRPEDFVAVLRALSREPGGADPVDSRRRTGTFEAGVYGASEMFVHGFLELMEAGILTRRVFDDLATQQAVDEGAPPPPVGGVVAHCGFFLGPASFYARLRSMAPDERALIDMTSIEKVNSLDHDTDLRIQQRRHARFVNTAIHVALDGSASSDTLDDGRVVSGAGGQFDFVEMARRLPGARSIMLLRSVHDGAEPRSNIVATNRYVTCPAHLRDLVVTEYGVADLRDRSDGEVAARLIEVADSRFQPELVDQAKSHGRLPHDYEVPDHRRQNLPDDLCRRWGPHRRLRPELPFGSDLTDDEVALGRALRHLAQIGTRRDPRLLRRRGLRSLLVPHRRHRALLERMSLDRPRSLSEHVARRAVAYALSATADRPPARRPDPLTP